MKSFLTLALASTALAAASAPAHASTFVSFEAPVLGSPGYAYTAPPPFNGNPSVPTGFDPIPGVTFSGASGIQANGSAWGFNNAPDGVQTAFVQSYNGTGGSISIALNNLTANAKYYVQFAASGRPNYGVNPFIVSVAGTSTPFTVSNTTWGNYQTSFVANGPSETLTFAGSSIAGDSAFGLDAIAVAVPEPATWALMLFGFGMVGYGMRRRRQPSVKLTYAA